MKANVEHINAELPMSKALQRKIYFQKRRAFKDGKRLEVIWRKSTMKPSKVGGEKSQSA